MSYGQKYEGKVRRTRALDIHEVGVWRLYQTLELVAAGFSSGSGVEEVDGESLRVSGPPGQRMAR